MLVLDTECMRKNLSQRGEDQKNISDIVNRFSKYEGMEVKLYVDSMHGYLVNNYDRIEIPVGWCRYQRKEVAHDSNVNTRRNR